MDDAAQLKLHPSKPTEVASQILLACPSRQIASQSAGLPPQFGSQPGTLL